MTSSKPESPLKLTCKVFLAVLGLFGWLCTAQSAEILRIGYLYQELDLPPALSNIDERPADEGIAGGKLGIEDNNTTGKFTKQKFELVVEEVTAQGDVVAAYQKLLADGIQFIVLNLHAAALDKILAVTPENRLLFNAGASDRRFRAENCHPQVLHTALSRNMKTDALAQFFMKKRWREWYVVAGPRPEDALYAESIRRSAKKFGLEVVAEKTWTGEHDARRTAQAEVPLFTQGEDYDVLMVADEIGDFGDYLQYNTWNPSLVAGTQALVATAWGRPIEQWGAAQLQERFLASNNRWMNSRDYAVWVALRSIGEGALRSRSMDYQKISDYIRSEKFKLAAFKGRKLSYRSWNGQLRQPVPLLTARAVVAQAPLEGFLHQHTELDTLGIDEPQQLCNW